jgi:hypothetical protein
MNDVFIRLFHSCLLFMSSNDGCRRFGPFPTVEVNKQNFCSSDQTPITRSRIVDADLIWRSSVVQESFVQTCDRGSPESGGLLLITRIALHPAEQNDDLVIKYAVGCLAKGWS